MQWLCSSLYVLERESSQSFLSAGAVYLMSRVVASSRSSIPTYVRRIKEFSHTWAWSFKKRQVLVRRKVTSKDHFKSRPSPETLAESMDPTDVPAKCVFSVDETRANLSSPVQLQVRAAREERKRVGRYGRQETVHAHGHGSETSCFCFVWSLIVVVNRLPMPVTIQLLLMVVLLRSNSTQLRRMLLELSIGALWHKLRIAVITVIFEVVKEIPAFGIYLVSKKRPSAPFYMSS